MRNNLKLITAVTVVLLSISKNISGQTTIVVARVPEFILIGADSKLSFGDKNIPSESVCKIVVTGNVIFAAAGVLENRAISWRVKDSAMDASKTKGKLLDKVNTFEKLVIDPLLKTVEQIKRDTPLIYERKINNRDKIILQIVFATIEESKPVVLIRDFQLTNAGSINVVRNGCPGECNEQGAKIYYFGQDAAIKKYLAENKSIALNPDNITPFVINLIGLEIKDKPEEVGPPIDVIKIDKNGANWVQKKDACPAIKAINKSTTKLPARKTKKQKDH